MTILKGVVIVVACKVVHLFAYVRRVALYSAV